MLQGLIDQGVNKLHVPRKLNEDCYKTIENFQGNKNVNVPLHVQKTCKHSEMEFITNQTNPKKKRKNNHLHIVQ